MTVLILDESQYMCFCHFLSPDASISSWTQTLNLRMVRRVFYNCATAIGQLYKYNIPTYLVLSIEWSLNDSTYSGWKPVHLFFYLFSPSASIIGWSKTLNLGMIMQVFYHCASLSKQWPKIRIIIRWQYLFCMKASTFVFPFSLSQCQYQ